MTEPVTFKSQLHKLATTDRTATVQTMLEVLSELGAIREAAAAAAYDSRVIGSHYAVRQQIGHEIGRFLLDAGVIQFETEVTHAPAIIKADPIVGLRGSLWILLPGDQQPEEVPAEIAEQARQAVEPTPSQPEPGNAWDRIPIADLIAFARRDDCLDTMVPSDLRMIVGRLARAEAKAVQP